MRILLLFQRLNERISFLEPVIDLMGTTPLSDHYVWFFISICLLILIRDLRKK